MKARFLGLQDSMSLGTYDKTKTSVLGRAYQKTVNSKNCLGPAQNKFLDCNTDGNITPSPGMMLTDNGRLFIMGTITSGVGQLLYYDFNLSTGVSSYVGKIQITMPNQAATTHTVRGLKVYNDAGNTGWKIALLTTGSVAINGGLFVINKVDKADFGPVSFTTFPTAITDDSKGVYFYQSPTELGSLNLHTTGTELILNTSSGKIYSHNGISATHQFYSWDLTVAPTINNTVSCTTPIATPGVVNATAHGFVAGDVVVFSVTGGSLPTGLTAGTVYFVIAAGLTANAFQVSLTSGGAAIAFTGTTSGTQVVRRGFGQSANSFVTKTGNLPALSGTLLQVGAGHYVASSSYISGSDFGFFATTTNIYMGKLSELTSGAVTWPSLITANVLGAPNTILAPTAAFAQYSATLDRAFVITNASIMLEKGFVNNAIEHVFGQVDNTYFESNPSVIPSFGLGAVSGVETRQGWLLLVGNAVGQRGVVYTDARSDDSFDYSTVISKVFADDLTQPRQISTIEENYDITGIESFYYRASNNYSDTLFDSKDGGWVSIASGQDLIGVSGLKYIQIKINWSILDGFSSSPAQVVDVSLSYDASNEISDSWAGSVDNSSQAGSSPCRSAFRLKTAYASLVPTLYFRAYDDSGNLVASANTVTNAADFQYSTNNGSSWSSLGTIPNVALTTEVRYNWTSPPGVAITVNLKES